MVSSRSIYCSVAYQGAQGVDWDEILRANSWKSLILPDLYVILDADPAQAFARSSGKEKIENQGFLEKVREEYLRIHRESDRFPSRIILVDASPPLREVFGHVRGAVEEMMSGAKDLPYKPRKTVS